MQGFVKIIIFFLFSNSTFAQFISGYCENCDKERKETYTINRAGMVQIVHKLSLDSSYERIETITDESGEMLYAVRETFKNKQLFEITIDDVKRRIIRTEKPCEYIVLEPLGDSTFFAFNADGINLETIPLPEDEFLFMQSKSSKQYKTLREHSDKYGLIRFRLQMECWEYNRAKEIRKKTNLK
jgi:hypothetical protein